MKRLREIGLRRGQVYGLILFFIIGLLHKWIAREASADGLGGLIPYAANTIDKANRNISPFATQEVSSLYYRHWLGTDPIGRDVLAGLISGTNVALKVGLIAVAISVLVGIVLGFLSGYYGNKSLRLSWGQFVVIIPLLLLSLFYLLYGSAVIRVVAVVSLFVLLYFVRDRADKYRRSGVSLPIDNLIMRSIEVINALPGIFIVLIALSIFKSQSLWNVVLVIAFVKWPAFTRFFRAEILKIKEQDYIQSAQALGLPDWKIFRDTILPIAISPIIIASSFSIASAILIESTLSFLGIGLPADLVTWGSILTEARSHFSSWWLAIFPGLAIYFVILLFNSIGDRLNDYLRGI